MCHPESVPKTGDEKEQPRFRQFTAPLEAEVSLDNIGEVLALLDNTRCLPPTPLSSPAH